MIQIIDLINHSHEYDENVPNDCQNPCDMTTYDLLKFWHLPETAKLQEKLGFNECSSENERRDFMKIIGLSTTKALNVFLCSLASSVLQICG